MRKLNKAFLKSKIRKTSKEAFLFKAEWRGRGLPSGVIARASILVPHFSKTRSVTGA